MALDFVGVAAALPLRRFDRLAIESGSDLTMHKDVNSRLPLWGKISSVWQRPKPRINFLAREDNLHTIKHYLDEWERGLVPRVQIFTYESLPDVDRLPPGLWIFADVDRLEDRHRAVAVAAWPALEARYGRRVHLLNRPGVSLPRRELLERLHATGRNRFAVYGLRDWQSVRRYPVFIRRSSEHSGTLTPLLQDETELGHWVRHCPPDRPDYDDLLVVEFVDTSTDGVFRKYSAFRLGDAIVAMHILYSHDWHVKASSMEVTPSTIAEEGAYQRTNPHETELRELFDIARIDFGRMDYALLDGRVQVWEINTNPMFMGPRAIYSPAHLPQKLAFTRTIARLLCDLADKTAR